MYYDKKYLFRNSIPSERAAKIFFGTKKGLRSHVAGLVDVFDDLKYIVSCKQLLT